MLGIPPGKDFIEMRRGEHRTIHHLNIDSAKLESYFKFAFVRNPWEKMVSHFEWRKKRDLESPMSMKVKGNKANWLHSVDFTYWIKNLKKMDYDNLHTRNQLDWICTERWIWDLDKQIYIYRPNRIKLKVDFVGRVETMEKDWKYIKEKLNIKSDWPLARVRKTHHLPYWKYYDDECVEIVKNRYEDDINFFNYKFGEV
tara:strand:- start:2280 stop:2876 length:597 start_codon:yes stop_codon:yes gene_type:complete